MDESDCIPCSSPEPLNGSPRYTRRWQVEKKKSGLSGAEALRFDGLIRGVLDLALDLFDLRSHLVDGFDRLLFEFLVGL